MSGAFKLAGNGRAQSWLVKKTSIDKSVGFIAVGAILTILQTAGRLLYSTTRKETKTRSTDPAW